MPLMRVRVKLLPYCVLAVLVLPQAASAFGWFGHRLAGEVADQYLCAEAKAGLRELNPGYNFVAAGSWADKVRYTDGWRYTRYYHYMNLDDDVLHDDSPRSSKGDVLSAIYKYRQQFRNPDSSDEQRLTAMLFLVHFVADAHAPLHIGYKRDLGGNKVPVYLDGRKTNLHKVWDTGLLQSEGQSAQDYTAALMALAVGNAAAWQADPPETWVQESLDLRGAAYQFGKRRNNGVIELSDSYVAESKALNDIRLAQAGVRIAAEMNALWCPGLADAR